MKKTTISSIGKIIDEHVNYPEVALKRLKKMQVWIPGPSRFGEYYTLRYLRQDDLKSLGRLNSVGQTVMIKTSRFGRTWLPINLWTQVQGGGGGSRSIKGWLTENLPSWFKPKTKADEKAEVRKADKQKHRGRKPH